MRFYELSSEDTNQKVLERMALQNKLRIYIEQLIEASKAHKSPRDLGRLYYNIASIYSVLDRRIEAEANFRAAAYSFRSGCEAEKKAQAWLQTAELRLSLFRLDAQTAFEQAVQAAEANPFLQAQALHGIGRLKQRLLDLPGALKAYESALSCVSISDIPDEITLRNYILEGIASVKLEPLLKRATALTDRTNQDAEAPNTPPEDEIRTIPYQLPPSQIRSSENQSFWPFWPFKK
ncbi:MAG: hypothetical protein AB8B99_15210 [Phormidesmis sp.]